MATVINRQTLEVRASVNTPDYDPTDWIVNPALPDAPTYYWKVDGDTVVEMSSGEKATVDTARLATAKATRKAQLWAEAWALIKATYPIESMLQMLFLGMEAMALSYTTRLTTIMNGFGHAAPAIAAYATARAAVDAATTIAAVEAVDIDLSGITIPEIDLAALAEVNE